MKGVKYNLEFKLPDGKIKKYEYDMKELIENVTQLVKNNYHLDMKITKHIIYNIAHKRGGSKLINSLCVIDKV
tara:strand:- start:734 stop:952 length:219 start_codon:yes stop_codon:yes gene_type:complete